MTFSRCQFSGEASPLCFNSNVNQQALSVVYIKGVPRQAEVAQGVPGRLRPRIILTFRHYKGGRSSAKRIGRLYPRRNPWYLLSWTESTSGHINCIYYLFKKVQPEYGSRWASRNL